MYSVLYSGMYSHNFNHCKQVAVSTKHIKYKQKLMKILETVRRRDPAGTIVATQTVNATTKIFWREVVWNRFCFGE